MSENMQAGQDSGTQPDSGAAAPGGGAGGGQQGTGDSSARFNPAAGAVAPADGGNEDGSAVAGSPQSTPNGGAAAPTDGNAPSIEDLVKQNKQLEARVGQLKTELDGAISRRKGKEVTLEGLQTQVNTITTERDTERARNRSRDAVEAAISGLPPSRQKLAKSVAMGFGADGAASRIDLAGADRAATVKSITERMANEHPELLTEPAGALPAMPNIKGPSIDGGPKVQGVPGGTVRGSRLY